MKGQNPRAGLHCGGLAGQNKTSRPPDAVVEHQTLSRKKKPEWRSGRPPHWPKAADQTRSVPASRASRVIRAQSPAATASAGVSHDPPQTGTLGRARNCGADAKLMPPVGQKTMSGNGPPSA